MSISEVLERAIRRESRDGWTVEFRSATSARLSRGVEQLTLEVDGDKVRYIRMSNSANVPPSPSQHTIDGFKHSVAPSYKTDLNICIRQLVNDGWVLNQHTDTTASLTRPGSRNIDGCLMVFLLFCLLIPGLIYLFWPRDDLSVFLEKRSGRIHITGTGSAEANSSFY